MIENSFKAPLSFSPLKCTYFGKNHLNNISAKSEKNEIEKWPLRASFQCLSAMLVKLVLLGYSAVFWARFAVAPSKKPFGAVLCLDK